MLAKKPVIPVPKWFWMKKVKRKCLFFLNEQKNKKIIIIVTHDNAIKKYLSKQIVVGEINE